MKNRVLIVGYAPTVLGGVAKVVNLLRENIPYLDLHVALCYHQPKWKSRIFALYSLGVFAVRLLVAAPRVVQVIVGSPGDAVRTLPYILLARLRGCSICLHFHKNIAAILDGFPRPVRRFILWVWELAACDCFLSNRLRDELAGQRKSGKPQIVIPNPIAQKWLRQSILPRSERTRDVIFVGRWTSEKGIDELLSVMRSLDPGRPMRCDIYSDYSSQTNPENCVCHGWLPEDDVQRALRESKLLVLPSHAEAYPVVLLEAAACGTPFVATNIAGIPDIAEESQAGLLHGVGDVEGMRKAIERLFTDETLWNDCSRSGRRWVESLEVSKIVPRWHRLYADLGVKIPEPNEAPRGACLQSSEQCIASDGPLHNWDKK